MSSQQQQQQQVHKAAFGVSFPSPFFATFTTDTPTMLTLTLCDALVRVCPGVPARLVDIGSHATLLFGPLLATWWTSVLPFQAVLRLVDVTLYHGLHAFVCASVALARASDGILKAVDSTNAAVTAMAQAWRRYQQLHTQVC